MRFLTLTVVAVASLFTSTLAAPLSPHQLVITASKQPHVEGHRLIQFGPQETKWMSEEDVLGLIRDGKHFVDVTDGDIERVVTGKQFAAVAPKALPTTLTHQTLVKDLIGQISQDNLKTFLTSFSTVAINRYYRATYGQQSAQWLFNQLQAEADKSNRSGGPNVTVSKFAHSWAQFSVIATIQPPPGVTNKEEVVIGAHQDSINGANPMRGKAPGVDDDGSGVSTIFEAYRLILQNKITFNRPISFMFYAGEEAGLLGSQKIVADYKARNVPIYGAYQSDMAGWTPAGKEEIIALAQDYVDAGLTAFLKKVGDEYASVKVVETECGYGCSDHASWTKAGYRAAFAFESLFDDSNPHIHTADDTLKYISFPHMVEFVKIILGFAIELGQEK
ncbi:uncharacterized protein EV422DRAFT_336675 [Fimicolochytrium jonesii]|uniref:uncharacterized protein n=1 Tax=Fimicolochytrium jonesii TaxID=1396493 RepID=UPI0022FE9C12|nr:uncharacterized protein EV422DRAFT_336675 [Fimicolochytrium jonesii]KAI8815942.1 hypothetical protein EV422DRAFT_336675 [Fimicolochytrium jonesii]